ncbi:hypothetical protein J1N35_022503 [Gossypium stocksii]|uniref:Aminotransferase-like plant mobile domain-containing protein n=1 Tax=Gossypium stocksii TaxID=47602 RepID=A0A9D3VHR1_9ROSI|nr:hypothetical protein J1N35_022503 [Gossypium stocksii]
MPNNTSNRVHLKYLPLLEDFYRAGSYSWGSAVLAALYYELCRATEHGWVHAEAHMWCINTLVLNFSTVEWYNDD